MRLRSHKPRLPLELIAYIIDYIDSPATLNNCSRVCHAWLPFSRSHIFRIVCIFLSGKRAFECLQRLANVLEQSPCISTYVMELFILGRGPSSSESLSLRLGTVLPSLLYKFINLRRIAVSGIDWTNLTTPEIRSVVLALIDRPSLVHVQVYASKFAKLDHLAALLPPTLKRLDISLFRGAEGAGSIDEENKRFPLQKPCQLEYLGLDITSALADWLLNSQQFIDISNVHTLDVSGIHEQSESVSRIVRRLGSSLKHLIVSYSLSGNALSYGSIDVSHNPNIKSISFLGRHLSWALPSFTTLMSSLVAPNIEQIRFTCQFLGPRLDSIWEELDSILQRDQFTTLREVELKFLGVKADDALFGVVCRCLSTFLPSLHARGILHCSSANDP